MPEARLQRARARTDQRLLADVWANRCHTNNVLFVDGGRQFLCAIPEPLPMHVDIPQCEKWRLSWSSWIGPVEGPVVIPAKTYRLEYDGATPRYVAVVDRVGQALDRRHERRHERLMAGMPLHEANRLWLEEGYGRG